MEQRDRALAVLSRPFGLRLDYGNFDRGEVDVLRLAHLTTPNPYRMVGPGILALLCTWVAWEESAGPLLWAWLAICLCSVVFAGRVLRQAHDRLEYSSPEAWERLWAFAIGLEGLTLGIWWTLFTPSDRPMHVALVIALTLVIGVASVSSLAASPRCFVAMSAPMAVLPTLRLATMGGDYVTTAFLSLPLYLGILGFAQRVQAQVMGQIQDRLHYRFLARKQELVFTTMAEALVITEQGRITEANPMFVELAGRPTRDLLGHLLSDVLVTRTAEAVPTHPGEPGFAADGNTVTAMLRRPDGGTVMVEAKGRVLDARERHEVWICSDVTDRLADAEALQRLADRDHLTGLFNRRALTSRLERVYQSAQAVGLLLIDLDGFKEVNDRHGHEAGDRVLEVVVDRMVSVLRPDRIVGRMGGDEFLVIAGDLVRPVDLERIAERICEVLRAPVPFQGLLLQVSASIGLAMVRPERSLNESLAEADHNMYEAKRAGGNRWVGPSWDADIMAR